MALLGASPRLAGTVSDVAKLMSSGDHDRIRRRIAAIRVRFPQLILEVVTYRFPAEHPFSTHVFWLFNASDFAGALRRGRDNHTIMLVLDPDRSEGGIIPGYGLEPFLTDDALGHLLDLAGPSWESQRWADGILGVLNGLDTWLEAIAIPDLRTRESKMGEF